MVKEDFQLHHRYLYGKNTSYWEYLRTVGLLYLKYLPLFIRLNQLIYLASRLSWPVLIPSRISKATILSNTLFSFHIEEYLFIIINKHSKQNKLKMVPQAIKFALIRKIRCRNLVPIPVGMCKAKLKVKYIVTRYWELVLIFLFKTRT